MVSAAQELLWSALAELRRGYLTGSLTQNSSLLRGLCATVAPA